ncbi:MAG: class I SAM-dependent methyltransferase [Paracoccaceae bacterium]|jgi:predicted TPR repeat methyltransferase|nr:class I SAM-dependent methyltransferase [Paracoccaceae bacterium]MDP7184537.1 class I SAM-dependent methyltransferase [Paracoccaceae bacterium]
MSDKGKELLEGAYALSSPDDNIDYYRSFAAHYDKVFARDMGFNLPQAVASQFSKLAKPTDRPVADLGCGTGIVATLFSKDTIVDGFDISPEMLAIAAEKRRYRNLIQIDLTAPGPDWPSDYGAVVSSGTFTHGHLGPDALETAIGLGRAGCLFVLSINKAHYSAMGFEKRINQLAANGRIKDLTLSKVPIYLDNTHDHAADMAMLCCFRKG